MYGIGDHEDLLDQIERLKSSNHESIRRMEEREQALLNTLGDAFAALGPVRPYRFDWEDTQTEHYAKGLEGDLMRDLRAYRDAAVLGRELIERGLRSVGVDAKEVGAKANERRRIESMRREAAALRKRADELEALATKPPVVF